MGFCLVAQESEGVFLFCLCSRVRNYWLALARFPSPSFFFSRIKQNLPDGNIMSFVRVAGRPKQKRFEKHRGSCGVPSIGCCTAARVAFSGGQMPRCGGILIVLECTHTYDRQSHLTTQKPLCFSQDGAAQSRKVRPKSMPQGSKVPKLEDLRSIKEEPTLAPPPARATATAGAGALAAGTAAAAGGGGGGGTGESSPRLPKQRLLIKIPRRVVTAATAHAAEVAAAEAACAKVKEEPKDSKTNRRGKGKSGVKRARPLAGTRASPPPPPPPAPTSRQVRFCFCFCFLFRFVFCFQCVIVGTVVTTISIVL